MDYQFKSLCLSAKWMRFAKLLNIIGILCFQLTIHAVTENVVKSLEKNKLESASLLNSSNFVWHSATKYAIGHLQNILKILTLRVHRHCKTVETQNGAECRYISGYLQSTGHSHNTVKQNRDLNKVYYALYSYLINSFK